VLVPVSGMHDVCAALAAMLQQPVMCPPAEAAAAAAAGGSEQLATPAAHAPGALWLTCLCPR
jgi:hypothetical protein